MTRAIDGFRADVGFGVIGAEHAHIYTMVDELLAQGAQLVGFSAESDATRAVFGRRYSQPLMEPEALLTHPAIRLIVTAATPSQRAEIGVSAMKCGHDVLAAKPGVISFQALEEVRAAEQESGRRFMIWYSERLNSPATLRAIELAADGAIGDVVHVLGLGPHRLDLDQRPPWFADTAKAGGILTDIGSHQTDHFLHFTRCVSARVEASAIANRATTSFPDFSDYGELSLAGGHARGFARVDWLSPIGLGVWGDSRTLVMGTAGYLEVRRTIDLLGRPGGEHLFVVDQKGPRYIDCRGQPRPFFADLVADVKDRSSLTGGSVTGLLAAELAIMAQAIAIPLAA